MSERAATSTDLELACKRAVTSLTRTPCTHKRLVERLTKQGFDDATARHAADEMQRIGYVDDRALAHSVVQAILRKGPAGERLLIERLRKRGVDRALAEEVAREALSESDPQSEADRAVLNKVRAMPPATSREAAYRRAMSYLARRGVAPDIAGEAVRKALKDRETD